VHHSNEYKICGLKIKIMRHEALIYRGVNGNFTKLALMLMDLISPIYKDAF
jgi:hypothetical protein